MARGWLPREKVGITRAASFHLPQPHPPIAEIDPQATRPVDASSHNSTPPENPTIRPTSSQRRLFRVTRFRQPQQTHINSIVVGVIDLLGANADVQKVLELAAVVFHVLSNAIDQPTLRCFFDVQRFSVNGIDCGFRG